jgi:hypothetical protein
VGGAPAPVKLVEGSNNTAIFTATGGFVYYGATGGLQKVAVTGGAPSTVSTSFVDASAFAHDATNVYWAHQGCVFKAPK